MLRQSKREQAEARRKFLWVWEIARLMADVEVISLLDKVLVDNQELTGQEADALWDSGYIESTGNSDGSWTLTSDGWAVINWESVGGRTVFHRSVADGRLTVPFLPT